MDGPEAGTVPCGHVLVERPDGISTAELTEFLVHVVRPRAGVVAQPDAEVLDFKRFLFMDLQHVNKSQGQRESEGISNPTSWRCKSRNTYDVDTNDLPTSLLDLLQLPEQKNRSISTRNATLTTAYTAHLKKYQNRDLATTSLGAKMRMR